MRLLEKRFPYDSSNVRIQGGTGGPTPPEKSEFRSNTGPDPLKNHKATKPAFNGVSLAGRRWPDFSSIWIHSLTKKERSQGWTPLKNFLDPRLAAKAQTRLFHQSSLVRAFAALTHHIGTYIEIQAKL